MAKSEKTTFSRFFEKPTGVVAMVFLILLVVAGIAIALPYINGKQVSVTVVNKITLGPLEGVKIEANGRTATTDKNGIAKILLPKSEQELGGTIRLDGYNTLGTKIKVTGNNKTNKLSLTPAGKIFYMSKKSGKVSVMSSDLDGTDTKTVLVGTGSENGDSNALLSTRDWKYLTLQAKRDSKHNEEGQLYLINAKTGELKTIENGDDDVQLVGWARHKFIYIVTKVLKPWEDGHYLLKSYDADSGKVTILEKTTASGTNEQDARFETVSAGFIFDQVVVYTKNWVLGDAYKTGQKTNDAKASIVSVNSDGTNKHTLKEFSFRTFNGTGSKLYAPKELYFKVQLDSEKPQYFEYEDGEVESVKNKNGAFESDEYPTYLISPSDKKTLWSELRDGKNTLFIGNDEGEDDVKIAKNSDFSPYGWFSDDYIILSKNDRELYVAPAKKSFGNVGPLKITDYFKPLLTYPTYGSGYGGI